MGLAISAAGFAPVHRPWFLLASAGDGEGEARRGTAASDAGAHAVTAARVRMLGGFQVVTADGSRAEVPATRGDVVKFLAIRGHAHVDELTEVVWPGLDPATGRRRLRNVLTRLRAACGDIVERTEDGFALARGVVVDVHQFEADAHEALRLGPGDPRALALAGAAVATYRGELLPGDRFRDWTAAPRERLRRRFVGVLDLLAMAASAAGDVDEAVHLLELAIDEEPYDEARYLRTAMILLDAHRRGAAAMMLRRASAMLDDLGVSPSRGFQEVERRLRET